MKKLLVLSGVLAMLASCGGVAPPAENDATVTTHYATTDARPTGDSGASCVGYSFSHKTYPMCPVADNASPRGEYRTWSMIVLTTCDFVDVGDYLLYRETLDKEDCGIWSETTNRQEVINGHQCCVTSVKTHTTKLYSRIGKIHHTIKCAGKPLDCVYVEAFGHTYLLDKN